MWSGDDKGKERKRNGCLSSGTTRPARPTRVNSCLQEEKMLVGWAVQSHLRTGRRKRSIGLFTVLAAVVLVLVHCCLVLGVWLVLVRTDAGKMRKPFGDFQSSRSLSRTNRYKDKADTRKNLEQRTKSQNRECTVDRMWSRLGPVQVAYDMTSPLCSCWFVFG